MSSFTDNVRSYMRAGFPCLYITTHEERRLLVELETLAKDTDRQLWIWTLTQGWTGPGKTAQGNDPVQALAALADLPEESIYVFRDFHFFLEAPDTIRKLRDLLPMLESTGRLAILVGCRVVIPPELSKEIMVVPFTLPDRDALSAILDTIIANERDTRAGKQGVPPDTLPLLEIAEVDRRALLDAAQGLTEAEAKNILTLCLVRAGGFNGTAIKTVHAEKANALKQSGLLDYHGAKETLADVGGLVGLKTWLMQRAKAFTLAAREYGLPEPKGILLIGVPGTGKTLTAKAVANTLRVPLLDFDAGRVMDKWVGSSESKMREVFALAEAMAPCVLRIDEIEKAFGRSGGDYDSGASAHVLGAFLTWMQDKSKPVFVVATANDVSRLPAEFLRKGRFDEIFAVDLPTTTERVEIIEIHLRARGRNPEKFTVSAIADACDGFSGAEIAEAIVSALYTAFDVGREVTTQDIISAIHETTPLSETMSEQIMAVRQWAATRARPAGAPRDTKKGRKVTV